jgi:hypothetical protein
LSISDVGADEGKAVEHQIVRHRLGHVKQEPAGAAYGAGIHRRAAVDDVPSRGRQIAALRDRNGRIGPGSHIHAVACRAPHVIGVLDRGPRTAAAAIVAVAAGGGADVIIADATVVWVVKQLGARAGALRPGRGGSSGDRFGLGEGGAGDADFGRDDVGLIGAGVDDTI